MLLDLLFVRSRMRKRGCIQRLHAGSSRASSGRKTRARDALPAGGRGFSRSVSGFCASMGCRSRHADPMIGAFSSELFMGRTVGGGLDLEPATPRSL